LSEEAVSAPNRPARATAMCGGMTQFS